MTLVLCSDLSAADWIAGSGLPWSRLVGFGPSGFGSYARLRILPDPERPGQSENDVEAENCRFDQLPRLYRVLTGHTTTPEDCCLLVWEGFASGDLPVADPAVHVEDPAPGPSGWSTARPGWPRGPGRRPARARRRSPFRTAPTGSSAARWPTSAAGTTLGDGPPTPRRTAA